MPKLITPVRYESALDRLNAVRPKQLQDRVRRTVDIPVLNQLPIESKKSVLGTLAKCTQQGSLTVKPPQGFTNYQVLYFTIEEGISYLEEFWAQRVYKILCYAYDDNGSWQFRVTGVAGAHTFYLIDTVGKHYFDIVTDKMFLTLWASTGSYVFIDLYGFY